MKKKNEDVIAEVMTAMYAQDKLEEIQALVEGTTGKTISKAELIKILQRKDGLVAYEYEEE